ncbi:hypothetical protein GUITHDRAFT_133460 [Guillardia theta CCMP2712]|uniref:Centrosomal protein of 44 kDa n=2 Tax=Guillardia theta TaxID=55529 RepID=L1JXL0_GUITC|nr:hypothetical protein GUITHDRAFT_133460 [Guillardia theta CCMP2712]EKX53084.1 hypothetical protein GUITHDRAFT_133460 [Guillardia theta CCMP2712]|mmetsp:Transcript_13743/g.47598  ORF Transcript_13743/g.47598 Transcript_13743/m.47598 type:complete len:446 (+) Transcript_13743:170-1507(+)|eukprot:XP_005840064.1 hypothetical protein GUITHDRAFT_133460 [Guillardia theta CCMP2712]
MVRKSTCTTGDLANNIDKLRRELLQCKYPGPLDTRAWKKGNPADLLPLMHYALLGYSKWVHDYLVEKGYDLFSKTDIRFVETIQKIMREEFDYQPQLRVDQFFMDGFVERKIILVHDLLKLCQKCHCEIRRSSRSTSESSKDRSSGALKKVTPGRFVNGGELGLSSDPENEDAAPPRPLKPPTPQQFGSSFLELPSPTPKVQQTDRSDVGLPQMMTADSLSSIYVVNEMHRSSTELTTSQEEKHSSNSRFQAPVHTRGRVVREVEQDRMSIQEMDRMEELEGMRMKVAGLERQMEQFYLVTEKVRQLEHELKAASLISDGKIRFLEERVAALENQLELKEGKELAEGVIPHKKTDIQELQGSSELINFAPEGSNAHRGDGGSIQDRKSQGAPAATVLEVPSAASEPAFDLVDQEGEITDEKLKTFISSIRQRFKETHELLRSTRK